MASGASRPLFRLLRELVPGLFLALGATATALAVEGETDKAVPGYAGSPSCKSCHERFYSLWSTSRHGLAMQPYSDELASRLLAVQAEDLPVGDARYRAFVGPGQGFVRETGPEGEHDYPIAQVLGGKNICYFLTPLAGGRLQTLPLAYDVHARQWYDTSASGIHQGSGPGPAQAGRTPLEWRDPAYTFNTSCHGCHVSQMETNYDPASDTYRTTWTEPGINCETCHGPASAHNEVCAKAPKGTAPKELKIIRVGKDLTVSKRNDSCASCHAKLIPLGTRFSPGQSFLDHFDMVLLESPDYHPDGRDLGENFTFTSWLSSPCARAGKLDCVFCHTSSGRFKQASNPDQACLPCHQDKAAGPDNHTRHVAESPGARCIACHMPRTAFARMRRSDHSMLPPAPAASARFGSPNACTGCHADKDAAWADGIVRSWRKRDYQAPVLERAGFIDEARRRDYRNLPAMLDYIASPGHDPVFAASLVRLLRPCQDKRFWPAMRTALKDPSPLVRASAAQALAENREQPTIAALAAACNDRVRLVRVRAAEALAGVTSDGFAPAVKASAANAAKELLAVFASRPDDWSGWYNKGNYLLRSNDPRGAFEAYDRAMRLRPDAPSPRLNAAMAKARLNDLEEAEALLRQARELDPQNAAAAFNLGLVLAERGQPVQAAAALRAALALDPGMAEAAYNLGLLLLKDDPGQAQGYLQRAASLRPDDPKYARWLQSKAPSANKPAP